MADEEITLYYNEHRLDALRVNLSTQNRNLSQELYKALDRLYEQVVPADERKEVEVFIKDEEQKEAERREARRRFAVFHVCENGADAYFTSEHFKTFSAAAYRYRLYSRGELSSQPQSLADAFVGSNETTAEDYELFCNQMSNDLRISALIDFDLDTETVSVCDSGENTWRYYRLHDLSVAAFKAYRGEYHSPEERKQIFDGALINKAIDVESEVLSEIEPPSMQM